MSREAFEFVIYMIHACAKKWGRTPSQVYKTLSSRDCINGFLVPHYEILHTQGTDFIVNDIEEYMSARGAAV